MNGNPTAEQKRFQDWARNYGCVVSDESSPSIHHIKGGKMKLKGVKNAGEWYVLPVSYWWHQDGNNKNAIHVSRKMFTCYTGRTEKWYWEKLIYDYVDAFGKRPMSNEDYQIILDRA